MKTKQKNNQPASKSLSNFEDHSLFADGPPDLLKKLKTGAIRHDMPRGQIVFMQDDLAEWFYFLQSGWIKLYRQTLDGDEVVIDVLPPGTLFGHTDMFGAGLYACSAEIVQNATIFAAPMSLLRNEINDNPAFTRRMLTHLLTERFEQTKEIEHRSVMNAAQRLGCFMLKLLKEPQDGLITLHLPYDKTLIAARLGIKSETFSRALARLRKDVGISVKGATIEIPSMEALVGYSCAACSNAFPCDH